MEKGEPGAERWLQVELKLVREGGREGGREAGRTGGYLNIYFRNEKLPLPSFLPP